MRESVCDWHKLGRPPTSKLVPSKMAPCSISIRAYLVRENEEDRDLGSCEGRRDKEIFRWSHDTSLAVSSPLFRCRATKGRRALSFLVSLCSLLRPPGGSLDVVDQSNLRERRPTRPTVRAGGRARAAGKQDAPPAAAAGQAGKQEVRKAPLKEAERHLNHYYKFCCVECITETLGKASVEAWTVRVDLHSRTLPR